MISRPSGVKRGNKRPRLDIGIIGTDAHAAHLSIDGTHPREIDIDDGDRVPFECYLLAFAIGRDDPPPAGARNDAPGSDLRGNSGNFGRLVAGQGLFQVDHRDVICAAVRGEEILFA
ncbi:MAG TPA: hypothetical protein VE689_03980, partial [Candidatus Udaeobacter sp.]|nr:hypothetical protein [Candidatus Udaeobacter sp.]